MYSVWSWGYLVNNGPSNGPFFRIMMLNGYSLVLFECAQQWVLRNFLVICCFLLCSFFTKVSIVVCFEICFCYVNEAKYLLRFFWIAIGTSRELNILMNYIFISTIYILMTQTNLQSPWSFTHSMLVDIDCLASKLPIRSIWWL